MDADRPYAKLRDTPMKLWKTLCALALCFSAAYVPAKTIVLGKLGQTLRATSIHASPTSRSRIYYPARPYEYLVLRTSHSRNWYRVLLSNGAFGYIRADSVALLPKDVVWKENAAPRVSYPTGQGMASREEIARYAQRFIGTPYKWGGNDIVNGIDCSGFVKKLYGAIGVDLPRTAAEQVKVGQPIYRLEDLRPGDRLYFWSAKRNKIGHTGIYIGGGYFTHASSGNHGVATNFLTPKWRKILFAARR